MAGSKGSKYYNIFLNYNVWLENKETKHIIINDELFCLLLLIEKENSLMRASEEFGVSYRKAWGLIKEAEMELKICLVKRQRGGDKGGRSELSSDGKILIEAYNELKEEITNSIHKITKKFFNSINV
jgi:molybdate transport system regulatory protein